MRKSPITVRGLVTVQECPVCGTRIVDGNCLRLIEALRRTEHLKGQHNQLAQLDHESISEHLTSPEYTA